MEKLFEKTLAGSDLDGLGTTNESGKNILLSPELEGLFRDLDE